MSELYEQRVKTMKNVAALIDNGRMPILDKTQTWAVAYGGGTLKECLEDVDREIEIYGKHLKDMYFDGVFMFGLNRPLAIYENLGFSPYFISPDGIVLQCNPHLQIIMDDEIEKFADNPRKFLKEVAIARRYPGLMQDYPKDVELLKNVLRNMMDYNSRWEKKKEVLKKEYELPMCADSDNPIASPFDQYVFYRGMRETFSDLRRRPQQVKAACQAILYELLMPQVEKFDDFPWATSPLMAGSYLGPKQFDEFMWPDYKKLVDTYIERGATVGMVLEGKWGPNYEHMGEFPKGKIVIYLEDDDYFEVHRKFGDRYAIGCPFSYHLLKTGTVGQVEDAAKRIIDTVGSCGTFFSLDKVPLTGADIKAENYAALGQVSLNYLTSQRGA